MHTFFRSLLAWLLLSSEQNSSSKLNALNMNHAKQKRYYRVFGTKMGFCVESEDKYFRYHKMKFEIIFRKML